jgi:hypothetical protein
MAAGHDNNAQDRRWFRWIAMRANTDAADAAFDAFARKSSIHPTNILAWGTHDALAR